MKNLLLGALCIVVMSAAGFGGYTYYENQKQEQMDPWIKANLAALADLENMIDGEGGTTRSGRARTVGCGSVSMHDWRLYCCPDKNYNNCPKTNPSNYCRSSPIFGCNDGPLRPL